MEYLIKKNIINLQFTHYSNPPINKRNLYVFDTEIADQYVIWNFSQISLYQFSLDKLEFKYISQLAATKDNDYNKEHKEFLYEIVKRDNVPHKFIDSHGTSIFFYHDEITIALLEYMRLKKINKILIWKSSY